VKSWNVSRVAAPEVNQVSQEYENQVTLEELWDLTTFILEKKRGNSTARTVQIFADEQLDLFYAPLKGSTRNNEWEVTSMNILPPDTV
jgi:hypothetical protein